MPNYLVVMRTLLARTRRQGAAIMAMTAFGALLGGCLAGERPPISSLYGDPFAAALPATSGGAAAAGGSDVAAGGDGASGGDASAGSASAPPEMLGPAPNAVVSSESVTVVESMPGAYRDVPLPGGRVIYGNRPYLYDPYGSGYPYGYGYGRRYPPRAGDAPPRLRPGQPRYSYPSDEVRCDNAVQGCYRWSGRQGAYVPDNDATAQEYGQRALRRGYPQKSR